MKGSDVELIRFMLCRNCGMLKTKSDDESECTSKFECSTNQYIESARKDVKRKPVPYIHKYNDGSVWFSLMKCPRCESIVGSTYEDVDPYCSHCGQAIETVGDENDE